MPLPLPATVVTVDRSALSVFHVPHAWAQEHYMTPAALWPSAMEEVEAFVGITPLLQSP